MDGIFYVIDSSDNMRFSIDGDNLQSIIEHPDLVNRKIPLVIILNKQDKENAFRKPEIKEFLKLDKLKMSTKMQVTIRECKGKDGIGFAECLSFFVDRMV